MSKAAVKKSPRRQMGLDDLKVEVVDLSAIQQHPDNPRMGDPENIALSVKAHGQYRAIVISSDGYILAGNHTYQALLGEGKEKVAVHRLPIKHDSQQAIEIMLADNRTSDFSRYDDTVLTRLLLSLPQPEAAAWDSGDVSRLLERMQAGGFLNDIAGGKEINALMHGKNVNSENQSQFSVPATREERDEITSLLNQLKERWELQTLTMSLLVGLRTLVESKEFQKKK